MKRNNIIGGIFFLIVGLIFAVYSRSVDIGDWSEPGAGFLPFYGGLIVIGMSLLWWWAAWWRGWTQPSSPFSRRAIPGKES